MKTRNLELIGKLDELEFTQGKLARRTGISETRLTRTVRGYVCPSKDEIKKICRALSCDPSDVGLTEQSARTV